MKKRDKENLEFIKNALEPVNEKMSAPDDLSENSIVSLVAGKEQTGKKKSRKKIIRTLASVTAALIVVIGVGAFINDYNSPAVKQIPQAVADAEFPLSGNDEKVFVDYFTALKAEYDENCKDVYFIGEIVFNKAADMLVEEDAMPEAEIEGYADSEMPTGSVTSGTADADHADFGTTNTQVVGVDEDDIIKNDGKYIYILSDWSVKIVEAESMKLVSTTDVYYNSTTGAEGMYLYEETLVVIGADWDDEPKTRIFIYDISDRKKPVKTDEFSQDGNYFSSRLVDGRVILLSQYTVYREEIEIYNGYARYEDIAPHTETNGEAATLSSQMISILPQDENYSDTYVVMSTIDLESPEFEPKTSAILGNGREVYCTTKNLYIIAQRYESDEESRVINLSSTVTVIHRFLFDSGVIEANGTGEVAGRILNQFSLDERDGYIRIATTLTESNQIAVLDKNLKQVAKIDGIAPGETIKSVRYIGNYGYVVTFLQTDPLFVIDFTDMKNPKIVGELKIPGFSSYLHPFNGYLVGIGTDGDESGETNALKISLFDISDPTNPQEVDRFIIRNAYAQTDHKTVMDCSHKDILGFIYTEYAPMLGYTDTKLCTLRIKDGKIEPIGSYSNSYDTEQKEAPQYTPNGDEITFYYNNESYSNGAVKRATYIGNTLYTVSANRICAYPLEGGKIIDMVDF